jgi:hypothetical protein
MLDFLLPPSTEVNAMRRVVRASCWIVSALLASTSASSWAQAPAGALEGKTFDVVLTEEGKESGDKDQLIFKDQKFESVGCRQYGFGPVAYTTESADGGATAFQATTSSATEGTIEWRGTAEGDRVEGHMLWKKQGQNDIAYSFSGTLAPAAAAGSGTER